MAARSPLIVGARVWLFVDGAPVAQATGFACRLASMQTEEYGLDDVEAQEITPGIVRVQGTINLMRRLNDGGAEGSGLGAPTDLVTKKKYSSLLLLERQTRLPVFYFEGEVVFEEQNWNLPAKGAMVGSVSWRGVRWANEVTGASPG